MTAPSTKNVLVSTTGQRLIKLNSLKIQDTVEERSIESVSEASVDQEDSEVPKAQVTT